MRDTLCFALLLFDGVDDVHKITLDGNQDTGEAGDRSSDAANDRCHEVLTARQSCDHLQCATWVDDTFECCRLQSRLILVLISEILDNTSRCDRIVKAERNTRLSDEGLLEFWRQLA